MALRGEIPYVVIRSNPTVSGGTAPVAVAGAAVQINKRNGTPATVYVSDADGASTIPNPLTTDTNGRIEGWLDEGSYSMTVSGGTPAIPTYTSYFEITKGDGTSKIQDNAVTTAKILDSAVTFAKLAPDVVLNILPAGIILPYATSPAPAGFTECDGTLKDGTTPTFLRLWQAIGTTFGGTGQSSFQVPDLRGRTPVGRGTGSGLSTRILGTSGGAELHTLDINEIPPHKHNISTYVSRAYSARTDLPDAVAYVSATNGWTGLGSSNHSANDAGGGSAHNNMPPWLALNFIIKL